MNELVHSYGGHYVGYEALWMSRDLYLNVWRNNVINENREAASDVKWATIGLTKQLHIKTSFKNKIHALFILEAISSISNTEI